MARLAVAAAMLREGWAEKKQGAQPVFERIYMRVTRTRVTICADDSEAAEAEPLLMIEHAGSGAAPIKSCPLGMPESAARCLELATIARTHVMRFATGAERDEWFDTLIVFAAPLWSGADGEEWEEWLLQDLLRD